MFIENNIANYAITQKCIYQNNQYLWKLRAFNISYDSSPSSVSYKKP